MGYLTADFNDKAEEFLADSRRWFPNLHESVHDAAVHFALGLAGEAGEVANLVKKVNRGDKFWGDVHKAVGHELADVIVYALDLAAVLNINIDQAIREKRAICEKRWG